MLQQQDLVSHFSDVVDLGDNVFRCKDVLSKVTLHYYVKLAGAGFHENDLLIVSENRMNDEFALSVFASLPRTKVTAGLELHAMPTNGYGLSLTILAPEQYHAYFKGRLDDKRECLALCMPIHRCEFSGNESVDDFFLLRRKIVPTMNWEREVHPKIELRFDNPRTRGGTGDAYTFVRSYASPTSFRHSENTARSPFSCSARSSPNRSP